VSEIEPGRALERIDDRRGAVSYAEPELALRATRVVRGRRRVAGNPAGEAATGALDDHDGLTHGSVRSWSGEVMLRGPAGSSKRKIPHISELRHRVDLIQHDARRRTSIPAYL
jgi:hypothetical protein